MGWKSIDLASLLRPVQKRVAIIIAPAMCTPRLRVRVGGKMKPHSGVTKRLSKSISRTFSNWQWEFILNRIGDVSPWDAPRHERIKFLVVPLLLGVIAGMSDSTATVIVAFVLALVWAFWFRWSE